MQPDVYVYFTQEVVDLPVVPVVPVVTRAVVPLVADEEEDVGE
jgi:hypothetical protein